jgi:hypothetical protein
MPKAQELTVSQLLSNPEAYESELIRIKDLRIQGTGAFAQNTNYNVWDGNTKSDSTVLSVIASTDTELDDAPALNIPSGKFTFEGILRQSCTSPLLGCLNGYQLQGTRKADITAVPSTDVKTAVSINNLNVYPNPVTDNLYVVADSETINYTITDVTGRVMLMGEVKSGESLNVQSLNNGVYIFRTGNANLIFVKN